MTVDPRTPVIVGAGQYVHRAATIDDGVEPAALMAEAVRAACCDAGLRGVPSPVDSIRVVNLFSWRYGNAAWVLARRLGIEAAEMAYTTAGGHSPQALVNRTALDIAAGRRRPRRARRGRGVADEDACQAHRHESRLGQGARGRGPADHRRRTGDDASRRGGPRHHSSRAGVPTVRVGLPSRYRAPHRTSTSPGSPSCGHASARSRPDNPYAWSRVAMTPGQIVDVTPQNRIVGLPYRKVMNANNDVDMAAALVLCSAERADGAGDPPRSMGVPARRYRLPRASLRVASLVAVRVSGNPHRWTAGDDPGGRGDRRRRASSTSTRAFRRPCRSAQHRSGSASTPSSPGPAVSALPAVRGTTTRCTPSPRSSANCATVLPTGRWSGRTVATSRSTRSASTARRRRRDGFRHDCPQRQIDELPARSLATSDDAAAEPVEIEAYTVMYDREGAPEQAIAACRLPNGQRAWGSTTEPDTTAALTAWRVGRPNRPHRQNRNPPCLSIPPPIERPRIILDCDPGHDDAIAIVVAAHACDLAGITTVAGNASLDRTTHNALVMRELLGIDVPVHAGAARPLVAEPVAAGDVHGASGLDGSALPEPTRAARLRRRCGLHHRVVSQPTRARGSSPSVR